MTYGLLDDKLHSDPRFLRAVAAVGVWTLCVSWARDVRSTDGRVPEVIFRSKGGTARVADALIGEGIIDRVEGGYYLHGYRRLYAELDQRRSDAGRTAAGVRWASEPHAQRMRSASPRARSRVAYSPNPNPTPVPRPESGEVSPHPSVALAERRGPVEAVFDEWKQATGRNGRTVLDGKRRTVIARALKTHGEATVLAAVRGWVNDPWPERPLHTDVSVLLRDPAHIEKFAGLWQHGPPSPTVATNPIDARVDRMMGAGR